MNINAPRSFIDIVHLLVPQLKKLCEVECPISIIDNYRGDELIRGYFDRKIGIVLYVNRIYNYNKSYMTNKINFILTFVHEAIHSKRGFSTDKEEDKYFDYNDFMKLYELDCEIATIYKLKVLKPALLQPPYDLNADKLDKIIMENQLKCLMNYYFIITQDTSKSQDSYLINYLGRNSYIGDKIKDNIKMLETVYMSLLQKLPGFGWNKQYSGQNKDIIQINKLPTTNINTLIGGIQDEDNFPEKG